MLIVSDGFCVSLSILPENVVSVKELGWLRIIFKVAVRTTGGQEPYRYASCKGMACRFGVASPPKSIRFKRGRGYWCFRRPPGKTCKLLHCGELQGLTTSSASQPKEPFRNAPEVTSCRQRVLRMASSHVSARLPRGEAHYGGWYLEQTGGFAWGAGPGFGSAAFIETV